MYFIYKDYLRDNSQYKDMFECMKKEIHIFMDHFKDDPRFVSGWGHEYFCNEDGGRLIYDITKPFEHKCSICGRVYKGYQYDACYITMLRNEAIVTAVKAAIIFHIWKDETYLTITKAIINFYADNYENFCVHAKMKISCSLTEDVGGAGRIMPQGLNEAIVAIRIINALELIKEDVEKDWLLDLKNRLFSPLFDLLLPQKMHIHNIPTWINSAIGVMGFFFEEERWIKEATERPFHIFEQLKKGVTDSGFWYEGSIHYNFFALEGVMNFFVFANAYHYRVSEDMNEIVLHMFDAAYHYAFDNDIFPNPSDGWPNISLKTYSYVYYMAYKVFGEKMLPYLKHIEADGLKRARLPLSEPYYYQNKIPLERLLFAPDIQELTGQETAVRTSESFEASNCALLRNNTFNVFFKYGHQTKSHAHPDKMNVEIMAGDQVLTKDLSNSGYASRMCNEWHRKIAAHNTCVVNGQPTDIEHTGHLIDYNETYVKAQCLAYDGVEYIRSICLNGGAIYDEFEVTSDKEGTIDWLFHFETTLDRSALKLVKAEAFEEYGHIMDVFEIVTDKETMVLVNDLVKMELKLEEGARAYLAMTYNNPSDCMRDTIIVRKFGNKALFRNAIFAL